MTFSLPDFNNRLPCACLGFHSLTELLRTKPCDHTRKDEHTRSTPRKFSTLPQMNPLTFRQLNQRYLDLAWNFSPFLTSHRHLGAELDDAIGRNGEEVRCIRCLPDKCDKKPVLP